MSSIFHQLWEWSSSVAGTNIDLICYILIGFASGLLLRDRSSRLFVGPILGIIGSVPGGLFFKWAHLFPYSHFVGAFFGAAVVVSIQRCFQFRHIITSLVWKEGVK